MNKYEDFIAGMEASRNSACEDYFSARPMLYVTREKEKIFDAGFEAAYKQQAETIERLKDANTESQQALEELADKIESSLYKRSRDDSVIEFHNGITYQEPECAIKPSDILIDIRGILATGKLNKLEAGEL